jgi:hypothetical protein
MSNVRFLTVYQAALVQGGWDILNEPSGGDAVLLPHGTKSGRNIWAHLHNDADGTTIQVADLGAMDLSAGLNKSCHVALYGVAVRFQQVYAFSRHPTRCCRKSPIFFRKIRRSRCKSRDIQITLAAMPIIRHSRKREHEP